MKKLSINDELTDFLLYSTPDGNVKVEVILNDETVWLTQKSIAHLFGVQVPAISKHLKNIFESGELDENSVISILETTATNYLNKLADDGLLRKERVGTGNYYINERLFDL